MSMEELSLTPRDIDILKNVFQCFTSPDALKIDTTKLAALTGFHNPRSANNQWLILKKKLMGPDSAAATKGDKLVAASGNEDNAKSTRKKGGRATKAKTPGEGEADDETTPSPKKKAGRKPKAALKIEPSDDGANEDVEATPTPTNKRRGPNKPKDPNAPPSKRAKKGANVKAESVTTPSLNGAEDEDDGAANAQLEGNIQIKPEDQDGEHEVLDEEEQEMVAHGVQALNDAGVVV